MSARPESLLDRVVRQLECDQMYVERFPIWDRRGVESLRDACRQAGRLMGRKARTFARPSGDGLEMVVLILVAESTTENEARFRNRCNLLLRQALQDERPAFGGE